MDTGNQFSSVPLTAGAEDHQVNLASTISAIQNRFLERLNGTYRTEALDCRLFQNPSEFRQISAKCIYEYKEQRRHDSLSDLTPAECVVAENPPKKPTFQWP